MARNLGTDDRQLYAIFRKEVDDLHGQGIDVLKWLVNTCGWKRSTVYAWLEDDQRCSLPVLALQQAAEHFKLYETVKALCRRVEGHFIPPYTGEVKPAKLADVVRECNDVVQDALRSFEDGRYDACEASKIATQCDEAIEALMGFKRAVTEDAKNAGSAKNVQPLNVKKSM